MEGLSWVWVAVLWCVDVASHFPNYCDYYHRDYCEVGRRQMGNLHQGNPGSCLHPDLKWHHQLLRSTANGVIVTNWFFCQKLLSLTNKLTPVTPKRRWVTPTDQLHVDTVMVIHRLMSSAMRINDAACLFLDDVSHWFVSPMPTFSPKRIKTSGIRTQAQSDRRVSTRTSWWRRNTQSDWPHPRAGLFGRGDQRLD